MWEASADHAPNVPQSMPKGRKDFRACAQSAWLALNSCCLHGGSSEVQEMEHAYLDLDGRSYGMRPEILVRYVQKQGSKGRLFSATLGVCVPIASDSRLRPSRSSRSLSELQESRGSHAFHIPSRALIAPRTCGVASKHPDRLPRPLFSNAGSTHFF